MVGFSICKVRNDERKSELIKVGVFYIRLAHNFIKKYIFLLFYSRYICFCNEGILFDVLNYKLRSTASFYRIYFRISNIVTRLITTKNEYVNQVQINRSHHHLIQRHFSPHLLTRCYYAAAGSCPICLSGNRWKLRAN